MKKIQTKYPHLTLKLARAFSEALDLATTDAEKAEITSMLENAEKQLADNEDAAEKIVNELSVLLNETEKRMQKIRRNHKEVQSANEDERCMKKIIGSIKNTY